MKLNVLLNKTAVLNVDVGGDTIICTYKPGKYTPEFEGIMDEVGKGAEDKRDKLSYLISEMVVDWDLTDEVHLTDSETGNTVIKEVVVGLDAKSLRVVPVFALVAVMKAIVEDLNPNSKKSGSSASG